MKIFNKRASFEYELTGEKIEAGISLRGAEAKSIRENRADLSQSHVRIMGNQAFLVNANIPIPGMKNYDSTGMRKLLLHKSEILTLATKAKQGKLQIVPIVLYNKPLPGGRKSRLIKISLELGKPKRKFEKKEAVKQMDIQRDIDLEFKNR
ncbi:MAG TPA: SsrA-binding protein [Patescibacteria group bacterium]|nr:SsrA-binding protein [Patescibacteria group bacterium]